VSSAFCCEFVVVTVGNPFLVELFRTSLQRAADASFSTSINCRSREKLFDELLVFGHQLPVFQTDRFSANTQNDPIVRRGFSVHREAKPAARRRIQKRGSGGV
jgi:hypothetical protein